MKTLLLLSILVYSLYSCSKEESTNSYLNYPIGHITFSHSYYYNNCGDTEYWNKVNSNIFLTNDSIFVTISEQIGLNRDIPNLNNQTANLDCSNGDHEVVIFNMPYPKCVTHLQDYFLNFGVIKSKKNSVEPNNNYIDVQDDTLVIVVSYESYWAKIVVSDTAYIYPFN